MARTRIFTWANKHITLIPWGTFFGVKCIMTPIRHIYTSWGSYMSNMKRILQALTELWHGQEYSLGQISISPLSPRGQVFLGQMHHDPKRHIYTSWGSFMCNMKRILLAVTELWAGHEYHLDPPPPPGDKVMGSNESFPPKGTSRPPRGPTRAIWKESSQWLQSYGSDKNIHMGKYAYQHDTLRVTFFGVKCVITPKRHIYNSWGFYICNMKRILQAVTELWAGQEYHLDPLGDKVMESNESFPRKAHLDPLGVLHVQYDKNPPSGYRVMGRTRISLWPPRGQGHGDKWVIPPRKAHLDPLGVLHVQYEKNPPSGYRVMGRTRIFT